MIVGSEVPNSTGRGKAMKENKKKIKNKKWKCSVCGEIIKNGDKVHCGVWTDTPALLTGKGK